MSKFFTAKKKAEDLKQGGSNHITKSGFYPVSIIAPFVNVGDNGSTSVDLYVEHEGQKQVVYGNLRITNNDGSENSIGAKVFNQLVIISELEDVSDPEDTQLPIGKKEALKDCSVLEDLADIDVVMRVQMEYGVFKGNITEKKVIKSFFRAGDFATAQEIAKDDGVVGKGYEAEQKYADNVTYKDVTPEEVGAWIAGGRKKGTAGQGTGGGNTGTKEKPSFGKKKRFGAKKEEENSAED